MIQTMRLLEHLCQHGLYDAFHGRYHNSSGAIVLLFVIWGSFFFDGLSITTRAARVAYALSRDKRVPFSFLWRKLHPKHKVPTNVVWLYAAICILLGLPILKVNVVFTAITSICTIGWVGGYEVPIFTRMVMPKKNFKAGPFYLGKERRPICLVAFLWICYTCCVFLLPTIYPITWDTFNYAPVALWICYTCCVFFSIPRNAGTLRLVQWPLFLLSSKILLAVDLAVDCKDTQADLWSRIFRDEYLALPLP